MSGGFDDPCRHGQEQPHPAPLHPGPVVHARGERGVLLGQLAGAVGQLLRPQVARRRVLEVAGPVGRLGDDGREPGLGPVAAQHRERAHLARPVVGRPGAGSGRSGSRRARPRRRRSGSPRPPRAARRRARTPPTSPARPPAARTAAAAASLTSAGPGVLPSPTTATRLARTPPSACTTVTWPSRAADLARIDEPGQRAPQRRGRRPRPRRSGSAGFPTATASTSAVARSGAVVEVVIRMRASGGGKWDAPF